MRHVIKTVETAIATGDKAAAQAAIKAAQPLLQRAANKGVVHRNTISRKLSRMSSRIKAIAA
jgi:small subunit ribosomal protein S20